MARECCEKDFRCDSSCNKMLGCGRHVCERGCHKGECGDCPLQGKMTCPCGKRAYEGMACDVTVPLCGATCEKVLSCGFHRCHERCHRGPCIDTCRIMVTKSCRCGSLKKQVNLCISWLFRNVLCFSCILFQYPPLITFLIWGMVV